MTDDERRGLREQLARALDKRMELHSRKVVPKLWAVTDRLSSAPKAPEPVLRRRRVRYKIYGVILLVLGLLLLIPGLMEPEELPAPLAAGALATVSGVLYLWPRRSGPPRRELARAEKLLETLGVSENRTVVFREEGAAVQAGESIQDVPYTEFNALIETEDLYVLCFAQTGAFILRKRDMTEGRAGGVSVLPGGADRAHAREDMKQQNQDDSTDEISIGEKDMRKELPKTYEPQEVEGKIYQSWMDAGCFKAAPNPDKKPFCIVMPPPNVTGQLHMGHAMDATLQDILIRYKRMQGYEALWMPGTDHAGIATQIKVEEELRKNEGLTRYDLGREKFLERVWDWKHKYGDRIVEQQKKLGASCDWDRARFTMDEGCSRAVREAFCELYDKGLIYKGSRIINWCPHCLTALSDAEVEYQDKPGHLWYIRYPLADGSGDLVVATTRPETMMGDTGVAVNPEDERFKHLVGKTCILPIMNREIPIVADEYVELGFGTGAVKMTPAHDPNDFEVGLRHNLEVIRCIDDDGTINENGGPYNGMDRYECRKAIVKDLEEQGYLIKTEDYSHNVGTCYRCHNDVEPLISAQWFVKMAPLAKEALRVVNDGEVRFIPERFTKTYTNWMENVHDWCISRQLWWGHQIPAWTCADCGHITVDRADPTCCAKCGSKNITREEDVLDTWFSSALWPFSTLGWPDKTPELDYFYPTSVLVTGYDIIFFWVARMIFSGCEQMGKYPFEKVLIHGLVRDDKGRKMSKSLGNGIDPLEMAEKSTAPTPCASTSSPATAPATTCASTWRSARPCGTSPTRSGTPAGS